MAGDLESSLGTAGAKVAQYIEQIGTMTVESKYVVVAADGDADFLTAKPVARTTVRLDGDSENIFPMRDGPGGLQLDATLLELHRASVQAAIEYRARILEVLVGILRERL